MIIQRQDLNKMKSRERAALVNKLSGYKSPLLIGTKNHQTSNLTLISNCFHLGSDPALIGFISRPNTVPRHGLENILDTKSYTLNFLHHDILKQAHQTSARYPKELSEFSAVNLPEEYLSSFHAPFVKDSKLKMAMEFREKIDIQLNGTHLIIGEILFIHASKDFNQLSELSDIAVNGLDSYYQTQLKMRLSYAKPDIKLKEL